jgi:hypothetical protein
MSLSLSKFQKMPYWLIVHPAEISTRKHMADGNSTLGTYLTGITRPRCFRWWLHLLTFLHVTPFAGWMTNQGSQPSQAKSSQNKVLAEDANRLVEATASRRSSRPNETCSALITRTLFGCPDWGVTVIFLSCKANARALPALPRPKPLRRGGHT